ncbi:MAG: hypothetical protein ACTSWW_03380 [Promethearchaeota archaeon]
MVTKMNVFLMILGVVGFALRIWLTEFRLVTILGEERHFNSRLLTSYGFTALIFDLQVESLNLVIVGTLPMMLIMLFRYDAPFFFKLVQRKPLITVHTPTTELPFSPATNLWLIIERLTLHLPIIFIGLPWYWAGLKAVVFPNLQISSFFITIGLIFVPFLLLDPRIRKKMDWPEGLWLFLGGIAWAIGYYYHFFVWNFA